MQRMLGKGRQHVFLVPGFFGFAQLGGLYYFMHVTEKLELSFADAGVDVVVHRVRTLPTASIERRAARLLETIQGEVGDDGSPIHLVGHSTGGLDARLLMTPGATIPGHAEDLSPWLSRVRTVTTIATPHRGTPMASYFSSPMGQQLLRALSVLAMNTIRSGRVPLPALARLIGLMTLSSRRQDSGRYNLARQVYDEVLSDFSPDRREAIKAFLDDVREDQSLLTQLTPAAMAVVNAAMPDREGVRYGSVVTMAPPPSLLNQARLGFDAMGQGTYTLFRAMHRLASGGRSDAGAPLPALAAAFGREPTPHDSDGVVPTLSQPWGTILHAVVGDHLDVVGHFGDPSHAPPHYDWLRTGSDFRRPAFDALWEVVAAFMMEGGSKEGARTGERG